MRNALYTHLPFSELHSTLRCVNNYRHLFFPSPTSLDFFLTLPPPSIVSKFLLAHKMFRCFYLFPSDCLDEFHLHNGTCYKVYGKRRNFNDAEAFCNNLAIPGHLASYHSQEDYTFLQGLIP